MPDKTLHEVAYEARNAVRGLERLLEQHRKAARKRILMVTLVWVPLAMVIATGITITTISACFLGGDAKHPQTCQVLPGYTKTQNRQKEFDQQFAELFNTTYKNDKRLKRLEERIGL